MTKLIAFIIVSISSEQSNTFIPKIIYKRVYRILEKMGIMAKIVTVESGISHFTIMKNDVCARLYTEKSINIRDSKYKRIFSKVSINFSVKSTTVTSLRFRKKISRFKNKVTCATFKINF